MAKSLVMTLRRKLWVAPLRIRRPRAPLHRGRLAQVRSGPRAHKARDGPPPPPPPQRRRRPARAANLQADPGAPGTQRRLAGKTSATQVRLSSTACRRPDAGTAGDPTAAAASVLPSRAAPMSARRCAEAPATEADAVGGICVKNCKSWPLLCEDIPKTIKAGSTELQSSVEKQSATGPTPSSSSSSPSPPPEEPRLRSTRSVSNGGCRNSSAISNSSKPPPRAHSCECTRCCRKPTPAGWPGNST
mmetsp:Transcript_17301/g.47876  ORF Transcript_17301/g.47876 Transcript_17301/m.47876 type:complete len:246 (+) Transcript_17301:390-1127(+)